VEDEKEKIFRKIYRIHVWRWALTVLASTAQPSMRLRPSITSRQAGQPGPAPGVRASAQQQDADGVWQAGAGGSGTRPRMGVPSAIAACVPAASSRVLDQQTSVSRAAQRRAGVKRLIFMLQHSILE